MVVVEEFAPASPKTKEFLGALARLKLSESKTLIVQDSINMNLMLASRNVPNVDVALASTLNAFQLLFFEKIVFTKKAFAAVADRLRK